MQTKWNAALFMIADNTLEIPIVAYNPFFNPAWIVIGTTSFCLSAIAKHDIRMHISLKGRDYNVSHVNTFPKLCSLMYSPPFSSHSFFVTNACLD